MKKLWKCTACGFIHEGEDALDICSKCNAPKDKFELLSDEATDKIYSADRTNDIHMELISLATAIIDLCEEGMEINLDLPCYALFEDAKNESWIIKQRSKAEIQSHVSKDKW